MYKKILVASDGSGPSINATKVAAAIAKALCAKLTVATVSFIPRAYAGDISPSMREGYLDEWRHVLEHASRVAATAGVEPEKKLLREDEPASALLKEVEQGQYDLLVVGRTGASGIKPTRTALAMMGGVSRKLVANATCSVLVVH
jgi:nucleotide-binding universal stress UspA family protein